MTNDALGNYITLQLKIEEQLEALKLQITEAQDDTMPEEINWGHVSDLNYISSKLSELIK